MSNPMQGAAPLSPEHLFETINSYQRSASIKAAIELDLFTAVAQGKTIIKDLAERCESSERGMRILCDYLVITGFLTKDQGNYGLTAESAAFLDQRSPAYLGTITEFLLSPMLTDAYKDLASAIRKGGTVMSDEGTVAPENPIWVKFARAMAPLAALPAQLLARLIDPGADGRLKVLDIAAGHGLYGVAFAARNPQAEVVAVDWPSVLEVAKENAARAGITDRYRTIGGSAFDAEYGGGYDVVLLTNFLHHFDQPTNEMLLRKVYDALSEGGRAVTLEMVPNEDRVSPPVAASFSLMMLGTTPAGDAYTFAEFEQMFRNAGFSRSELHELPPTIEPAIISYR